MALSRRRVARLLLGGLVAGSAMPLLAACSGGAASTPPAPLTAPPAAATAANPLIKPRAGGTELTILRASSELAVGRNRFAIGLLDGRNQAITSGTVKVEFFKLLNDGSAQKRADADAVFRTVGGQSKGVWVSSPEFGENGQWGSQVTLQQPGDEPKSARMNFEVQEAFSAPGYGQPAVRSASLTERDSGGDLAKLCTNNPPCVLHKMSIADALAPGQQPLVVTFATPALCTSATCGPELDAVLALHQTYGERANFVHVEIYQYPFDGSKVAAAVDEWKLPSDPWTFVVDRGGIVRDRFEGAAPAEEMEPALKAVLS